MGGKSKLVEDALSLVARQISDKAEFLDWFGNSKAVHPSGLPRGYVHATQSPNIEKFNKSNSGIWFSPINDTLEADMVSTIDHAGKGYVLPKSDENLGNYAVDSTYYPAFLSIKNPATDEKTLEKFYNGEIDVNDLLKMGHDGLIWDDGVAVVAKPNQIKSPFNEGKFSTKDDRIAKGGGGEIVEQALKLIAGATKEAAPASRIGMNFKDVTKRIPELTEAAQRVKAGEMSGAEYAKLVNRFKPVEPYTSVPKPATLEEIYNAVTANKRDKVGKIGNYEEGHPVSLRLDIPAYKDHGVWAPTIHDLTDNFATIAHEPAAHISGGRFDIPQNKALNVAAGANKSPFASIDGRLRKTSPEDIERMANEALSSDDWAQVGMDPERHGYFYDRKTMQPVVSADEVIQVGPLVMARKPVYGNPDDFKYADGGRIEKGGGGEIVKKALKAAMDLGEEAVPRIKLRGKVQRNEPDWDAIMSDIEAQSDPHPFARNERIYNDRSTFDVSPFGDTLHLGDIRALKPNQGSGTELIEFLKGIADKHDVPITGVAKVYHSSPGYISDTEKLADWYRKRGFEVGEGYPEDGYEIRYNPRVAKGGGGLIDDAVRLAGKLISGEGTEAARAFKLPKIRPTTDNIHDVGSANFDHYDVVGNKTLPINEVFGGVNLSMPDQRARVDALKNSISDPENGYISRLIVDDEGNVVEGQHRLDALRELGATEIPVTMLRDKARGIDANAIKAAIKDQGGINSDHVNQLVDMILDDPNDYDAPQGFEKWWNAGADEYNRQRGRVAKGGGGEIDPYAEEIASAKALMAAKQYSEQPWSEWAGDVANNAVRTAKAILPTALGGEGRVGISDMARGAYEGAKDAATLPGDVLTGKQQLFDETGRPLESAVGRSLNFASTLGGASSLVPVPENSLRVFGGIRSKTADLPARAKAISMELSNASPEEIRAVTGWSRGKDEQWRYEIPDTGTTVKPETFQLDLSSTSSPAPMLTTLGDYIDHPALFEAYPEFKSMPVKGYYDNGGSWGYYMPRQDNAGFIVHPYIGLNLSYLTDNALQRSTLLHEIQHAIQQKEGFMKGANPKQFQPDTIPDPRVKIYEDAALNDPEFKEYQELGKSKEYLNEVKASDEIYQKYNVFFDDIKRRENETGVDLTDEFFDTMDRMQNEIHETYPLLKRRVDLGNSLIERGIPVQKPSNEFLSPIRAYETTAGEVESRNVQKRRDMPIEDLKNTPPWKTQDITPNQQLVDWDDISWRKGYSAGGDVDDVDGALRLARDVGGATNENPQVFMTDAQGRQYDAQGKPIQPTVTQDQSNSSAQETKEPQRENINTMFNVAPKNYYSDVQPFLDYAMTPVDRAGMPSEPDLVDVMRIATQVAAEGQPTETRGEGNLGRRREEFINNLYGVNPDQPNSPSANQAWIANRVVDFSPWALGEVAHDIPYEAGRTGDYGTAAIEGGINAALTTPVLGAAGRGIKKGYEYAKKFPLIPAAAAGVAGLTGGSDKAEAGKSDIVKKALRALAEEGGEAANAGIRAYQGSPHDFAAERFVRLPSGESQYIVGAPNVLPDLPEGAELIQDFPLGRMRMDKIGTGEGAQAFGHGIYTAESEPIAQHYKNALADRASSFPVEKIDMPKWILRGLESSTDKSATIAKYREDFQKRLIEAEQEAQSSHQPWLAAGKISSAKDVLAGLDAIERGAALPHTSGRMYEVNINADPKTFLDWDAEIANQSPKVSEILQKLAAKDAAKYGEGGGLDYYMGDPESYSGESLYRYLGSQFTQPEASAMLHEAGIPGIKFLDAGSRDMPAPDIKMKDGKFEVYWGNDPRPVDTFPTIEAALAAAREIDNRTRNYVVFDDKLISIIRKYGIAGASAMIGYNLMENMTPEQAKAAAIADDYYQKTTEARKQGGRVTGGNTYDNDPSVAHALALTSEY